MSRQSQTTVSPCTCASSQISWRALAAAALLSIAGFAQANAKLEESGCMECEDNALGLACGCETGNCGGSNSAGDSVYLFSGEFYLQEVDLRISGRGPDFVWGRKYRSRLGVNSAQGNSWDCSYNVSIAQSGADIIVRDGNTRADVYSPQPDGSWTRDEFYRVLTAEAPCLADLDGNGNVGSSDLAILLGSWGLSPGLPADFDGDGFIGSSDLAILLGSWGPCPTLPYQLTFSDTSFWQFFPFDGSLQAGKLSAIVDRNGNTLSFSYDLQGRLVTITDTLNRDITIAYNADGFIESVTDFDVPPRVVRYEYYDGVEPGGGFGDLKSVTSPVVSTAHNPFPAGKTTVYTYSTGFADERLNHNLLTITDPKGQLYLTNVYAATQNELDVDFDHVMRQVWGDQGDVADPAGDVIDFDYLIIGPTPANGFATSKAIVNDRVGNVKEFFYDQGNRGVIMREYTGRADPNIQTTQTQNRPVSPLRPGFDPIFFETRWEYNSDSRMTRVVYPNGNDETFVYDTANPSRRSHGNVIERRSSPGTHTPPGDQAEIVEEFEYDDGFGGCCGSNFVTEHIDGRGAVTTSTYDVAGNRLHTTHRIPSIVEDFEYNQFGQMTARTLPDNGSVHRRRDEYTYYAAGPQRGYLRDEIIDAPGFALTTTYDYDIVGNVVCVTDPRQNSTIYEVNELNQTVRELSRPPNQDAASTCVAGPELRYEKLYFFDANDNVVRIDIENRDESGALLPNTHFSHVYEYEILNYRTRMCDEFGDFVGAIPGPPELPSCIGLPGSDFLSTAYEYDANRNRTLARFGEAVNGNDPDNVVQTFYDERDLVFRSIRAPGALIQSTDQYDYDQNENTIRMTHGLEAAAAPAYPGDAPRITDNTYDGYDRLVSSLDPMGNLMEQHYDPNSNVGGEVDPINQPGVFHPFAMRTQGELVDIPGSVGNVRLTETMFFYDPMDRLIRSEEAFFDTDTQTPILAGLTPDGLAVSQTIWSDNTQALQTIDDNIHIATIVYDTANRVDIVTDPRGNIADSVYDDNSNVVAMIETELSDIPGDPTEEFTTTYAYDGLDRLVTTIDNVGNTHTFAYDSRDNQTFMDDALNHETRYVYDGINRLIKTVRDLDDLGADLTALPGDANPDIVTIQTWDDTSRLVGQTDDSDNTTSYTYDSLNRMTAENMADCTVHSYTYDVHDNRLTMLDANGSLVDCQYDLLDRLNRKDITLGLGVSADITFEDYVYDGLSRLVLALDDDSLITRSHDSLSRVTRETLTIALGQPDQISGTTLCLYDGVGNMLSCTYPGGRFITCAYDVLDRKQLIQDETGPPAMIASYQYVGPGRVARREYGNGTRTDYTYDGITGVPNPANDFGVKRIIGTTHSVIAGGAIIDDRTYAWDPMYNKTQRADIRAGGPQLTHDYAYDDIYRLTRTIVTDPVATVLRDTTYDLDGVGNRDQVLGQPDPGLYFMDPLLCAPADLQMNQYSATPFDDREYDENGNLVSRVQPGAGPPIAAISYDYRNQMVEYNDLNVGERHTYSYDALGRRIARVVDADGVAPGETRYFYDGWQVCEEQDAAGATQATYVYGLYIDEVLTMQRGGNDFFHHTDDLYNVMALTNAIGVVIERYEYADYGQPIDPTTLAPVPGDPSAIANPYLFTGRRYDSETGWHYYRTRYLDPIAGRFTTRDTIGIWGDTDSLGNGYTYAASNPWSRVDPDGQVSWWVCFVACMLDMDENTVEAIVEGDPDKLPRHVRRDFEKKVRKEHKKKMKNMTKKAKRAYIKKTIKKMAKERGLKVLKKKALKKAGKKAAAKVGGLATAGIITVLSTAYDVWEVCRCTWKCL